MKDDKSYTNDTSVRSSVTCWFIQALKILKGKAPALLETNEEGKVLSWVCEFTFVLLSSLFRAMAITHILNRAIHSFI